jgi:type VI secretion system protein ImpI
MDRLPDGGPPRVEIKNRGIDIGRDAHLDWTLPDPERVVSGKHCEVRYRDGEYWLIDVSRNGTFVNGSQFRLDAPYRLRDRDRLVIGPYVISVSIEGGSAAAPPPAAAPSSDVWGAIGDVAPPESRDAYRVRNKPATQGDFLDYATDAGVFPAPPRVDWGAPAPAAPPAAPAWGAPAPSAWGAPAPVAPPSWGAPPAPAPDEAWLTPPTPKPAPPPPDPRELPVMERPRPTRPAEPPPAPEPAPWVEPPAAAAPAPIPPAPVAPAPPPVAPAPPPPPPVAAPAPAAPAGAGDVALLDRIAAAAGIPLTAIAGRDPGQVADEIGAVLKLTTANLIQMAASRRQTKSAIRSAQHTMYKPRENNPLKFAASPEHAMESMFGPPNPIHLKAEAAVAEIFAEQKAHALLTFGAMQGALDALFDDLSPDRIEATLPQERGLSAVVASRKAKLWEAYAERWKALTKRADGRLNDAFMALFAQAYDRLGDKGG